MSSTEAAFIQGAAYGAAMLCRDRDEPVYGAEIIMQGGFTADDLRRARVDPYDLKPLLKALRDAKPYKPPRARRAGGRT